MTPGGSHGGNDDDCGDYDRGGEDYLQGFLVSDSYRYVITLLFIQAVDSGQESGS